MAEEGEKLYYSIREVAEHLGVNPSLIRYWEGEFPTLKPRKNRKGERFFTSEDIRKLELIQHLLKEKGFTIKGARQRLKESPEESERRFEAIQRLKELRKELKDWKRSLSEQRKKKGQ